MVRKTGASPGFWYGGEEHRTKSPLRLKKFRFEKTIGEERYKKHIKKFSKFF